MVNTIIFDWGGVLAPSDHTLGVKILSEKYDINKERFVTFCTDQERLHDNLVDDHLFKEAIEKEFNIPINEIVDALNSAHPNEVHAYAKTLAQKYTMHLLSDQIRFRTEHIKKSYDLSFFTNTFFSNEIKLTKPNRDVFEYVLKEIGKKPEECVFIDDKPENIKTARELGFATVLFTNLENLKKELNAIGIKQ